LLYLQLYGYLLFGHHSFYIRKLYTQTQRYQASPFFIHSLHWIFAWNSPLDWVNNSTVESTSSGNDNTLRGNSVEYDRQNAQQLGRQVDMVMNAFLGCLGVFAGIFTCIVALTAYLELLPLLYIGFVVVGCFPIYSALKAAGKRTILLGKIGLGFMGISCLIFLSAWVYWLLIR